MIDELSIIIPTLNEENYLPKLLQSIVAQNYNGKLQIIVVDGKSEDKTIVVAKKYEKYISDLTIIRTGRGVGLQRNKGAEKAKYKYLLFLDADIILPTNVLNKLSKKINAKEEFIDFVIHFPIKFNLLDYIWLGLIYSYVSAAQFFEPIVSGSFLLTTKSNHLKVNGFREDCILGEDVDYGWRSVKLGAKYHFHYQPHVLASPRRLREEGRLKLLWLWTKGGLYVRKNGPIYDKKILEYKWGQHTSNN